MVALHMKKKLVLIFLKIQNLQHRHPLIVFIFMFHQKTKEKENTKILFMNASS